MRSQELGASSRSSGDGADTLTTVLSLLRAVRAHWVVVLLVAAPMIAGAIYYTERLPAVYESESIILVEPRPEGGAVTGSPIVRLKAPTYVAYLTAPATTRQMAQELGLSASTVADAVNAAVQAETGNITVTVESTSPERAMQVASVAGEALIAFSQDDELLQASTVARPVTPTAPSGPPRRLIEAAAVVVSLGVAILAAVIVDRRRPRVLRSSDVEAVSGYPLLGRFPRRRKLPDEPHLAFADPAMGTAARSLRVRLAGELRPGSAMTVTSPLPGEGKTTVAAMLATAFARTGFRVVLVDGDMRRSRLLDWVDDWDGPGLAELVAGRARWQDCVVEGWSENLSVLPTRVDTDASEALMEQFADVLRELRIRYDIVLVDAPPVLPTDEAKTLASAVDTVVVTVAVGTPLEALAETEAVLAGLRAPVVGHVLNRAANTSGYGSYGYGYE